MPKLAIYDTNPEVLRVDTGEQVPEGSPLDVTASTTLKNLVGVMHYAFGRYTLLTDPSGKVEAIGGIKAAALPAAPATQFVVAGMNIENFFDDVDDPGIKEDVANPDAFQRRLKKISMAVREQLNMPDVIGTVEIENINALKRLAEAINKDAVAAGKPDPRYEAYLFEGNDGRGIDNGFLVKTSRIKVVEVKQFGKDEKYTNPDRKEEAFLNDRPPVMLRSEIVDSKGAPFAFTAVINHLKSYSGFNDPKQMANVRLKKKLQAEFLANWVNARQKADPNERLILLGDFNSYQFSDGVLDMIGTITGKPAAKDEVLISSPDVVEKDLVDLVNVIGAGQRYSFIFDGSAQALDHMLVSENLKASVKAFGFARVNADFPEAYRNDAARPERFSDHDPAVAYFALP
jgi:predicted extracellular nuclease